MADWIGPRWLIPVLRPRSGQWCSLLVSWRSAVGLLACVVPPSSAHSRSTEPSQPYSIIPNLRVLSSQNKNPSRCLGEALGGEKAWCPADGGTFEPREQWRLRSLRFDVPSSPSREKRRTPGSERQWIGFYSKAVSILSTNFPHIRLCGFGISDSKRVPIRPAR